MKRTISILPTLGYFYFILQRFDSTVILFIHKIYDKFTIEYLVILCVINM